MSELNFYEHSNIKNPKNLVIFLHGYGSNGHNLLELAHEFERAMPDAHFISPDAPQAWEGGFADAFQWFSLANIGIGGDPRKISDDINKANDILNNFIKQQLKRFQLTPENLFLIGFSQGAMMSMYHGLIMPQKAAGIIAYSGKLILPQTFGGQINSKPEICLIHGEQDSVVPFVNFLEAKKILDEHKIPFESHAVKHLDHTIDIHGVKAGMSFVRKILQK